MKAFLSHSSEDKEFVRSVALELRRQYCLLDEQAFDTGDEFLKSIRDKLDESCLFVLFASRSALKSIWVEFETLEAEYRMVQKKITKALVFLLEGSVEAEDLPDWLKRAKAKRVNAPKRVAREIRAQIDELIRERQQPYFVGRTKEIADIEQKLAPWDGSAPPRMLFVSGLPGIGRRSIVTKVSSNQLNLKRQLHIRVESGDSANDIALKVADLIEPYSTKARFWQIAQEIQALSPEAARDRTLANLKAAVAGGELPVFVDDGGLLDNEGRMASPVHEVVSHLPQDEDVYLFLVSTRRPNRDSIDPATNLPSVLVQPLSPDDTKLLIASIAHRSGVKLGGQSIAELAEYVGGFPPASYFALELVKDYGIDLVLGQKKRLTEFRATSFIRHLQRLNLTREENSVLQLLNAYSPLPLPVIGEVLQLSPESLGSALVKLMDSALVVPDRYGLYWLADPIADAVTRELRGIGGNEQHSAVADALRRYLDQNDVDVDEPLLHLSRLLWRSLALAGREDGKDAFHLASDLVKMTVELYHRQEYTQAIRFGRLAVDARPENVEARAYLIRALIQEEQFEEAQTEINLLRDAGLLREAYFLTGFMERKRRNPETAIEAYIEAKSRGWRGVALERELGQCYFECGDLETAKKHIDAAQNADQDNRYVVDLQIVIATRLQDEVLARDRLAVLEAIDSAAYYSHRLSTVEFAFGNYPQAFEAAQQAVGGAPRPNFHMLAQLIKCRIAIGQIPQASEELRALDARYDGKRWDDRQRLWIRWELAQRHWENALIRWTKLNRKELTINKLLKREALTGLLRESALPDAKRSAYERELEGLNADLAAARNMYIDIDFEV